MNLTRHLKATAFFALAAAISVSQLRGDERPEDSVEASASGGVKDVITVTGQQQERTLQDTVASVAVTSGSELEQSTQKDLYDLVAATPNVAQSFGYKGFSIRGIDQRGFGSGTGLLVSVKVDGVSLQNDTSTFFGPYSTWDLDQVEIFRGPQSTQQGRNSLAGSIILESARPTYEQQVKSKLSYGSLDSWQAAATVNVPLSAKAALRLSVDQRRSDGWVDNPTRGEEDYDFRESLTVRGKLRFDPSDRFRGLLTLSYTDSSGGEDLIDESRFPGERLNFSNESAEEGSRHQIASLELAYDLNDRWTLESLTSSLTHDYLRVEDGDMSFFPGNLLDIDQDDQGLTQQLRLLYNGSERAHGVLGLYYADLEDDSLAVATLPGEVLGIPGVTVTGSQARLEETENLAVFGEFDLRLGERWTMTLGARFDDEQRSTATTQESLLDPPIFALPSLPPEVLDADYSAFLPKLGVTLDWSDDLSTSLSVQRGYRAGGRSLSLISQRLSDYDPEYTTNYELALRSRSSDRNWRFNANAFYVDWEDQQVAVRTEFDLEFDTVTINAGSSRLYGLEGTVEYQPRSQWRTYLSVGFVETEFESFVDQDQDFSGNEFPFAPSWSWTLGGHWQWRQHWNLDAQINWQDAFFSEPSNLAAFEVDDRTLVNLKLGRSWRTWGLNVFARNLLDEDYLLERLPSGSRTGEPRVFGLEWTFGL